MADDTNVDDTQHPDDQQAGEAQAAVEQEAKLYGWVPKEEFHGPETDWVDAAAFVQRGKEINPILRKNNERLLKELKKNEAKIAELDLTLKEFGETYKTMSENAYNRAIEDVKGQIKAARRDGNVDDVDDLTEQLDTLKEQQKDLKVPGATSADIEKTRRAQEGARVLEEWQGENPWYNEDTNPAVYYAAEGIAFKFSKTEEGKALLGKREFLDKVTEKVKAAMPESFKNKRRADGSPVGGTQGTRSAAAPSGKKSYADLPADAKAACDRQVKSIPGFTKDKYVQFYFEQEGA
jgi:hypothetical protein